MKKFNNKQQFTYDNNYNFKLNQIRKDFNQEWINLSVRVILILSGSFQIFFRAQIIKLLQFELTGGI